MKKKLTIRDIAKQAGVSVATVSNVLNNVNKVSEETKKRILEIMDATDYHPDFTARSLANRKSHLIGIMLPLAQSTGTPSTLFQDNPFYGEFINGVEYGARQKGYDVLITGIGPDQSCREWIMKRNLDGVIFLGIYPEHLFNEFKELNLPIVLIDTYEEYTSKFNNIGISDIQGGYIATKYLLDLGHRNVALATSIGTSEVNARRYEGYAKALQEFGIPLRKELIYEDLVSFDGGYRIGEKILAENADVTAIFAVADILAFGIINILTKNNKKIPDDFSLVGFDDLKICQYVVPGLTTVRQDVIRKGIVAADTIINEIETGLCLCENITLPLELVVRDSTRRV